MKTFEHGTSRGYRHNACRCEECKAWKRAKEKRYRRVVDVDDLAAEKPMTLDEKIAEVEWLGTSDTVEHIATRLGYANINNLLSSVRKHGRQDLVDKLIAQRNLEWNHGDEE